MDQIIERQNMFDVTRQSKLSKACAYTQTYLIKLANYDFIVHPDVFNPDVFESPRKIVYSWIDLIRTVRPNSLLEIGAGAGYMSILAALNGAKYVTATDINLAAIANMQANIDRYNLNDRIRVLRGSIFEPVDENEKFDVIFWNIPLEMTDKPLNELSSMEKCLLDPGYKLTETYIKDVHKYLSENGHAFTCLSATIGNIKIIMEKARSHGFLLKLNESCNRLKSISCDVNDDFDVDIYEIMKI